MYLYKNAKALGRAVSSVWVDADFDSKTWAEVLELYTHAYITAYSSYDDADVYIDINTYRDNLTQDQLSISPKQWLTNSANTVLVYTKIKPNTTVKYAKYNDAVKAGYRYALGIQGIDYVENYPYDDRADLAITRPAHDTDMRMIDDYCLLILNGLVFPTQSSKKTTYVPLAVKAIRDRKSTAVGLLSFYDIGKLNKIKITPSMVNPVLPEAKLKEKIYITVEQDLNKGSFFFVLGGFLILMDNDSLKQTSDNTVCLDISKIPFVERIVESLKITDMSHLGLTKSAGYNTINLEQLFSDEVLLKLLTGYNSFLVYIDNVRLRTKRQSLRTSRVPGSLVSWVQPQSALIGAYGKLENYWSVYEDSQWAVNLLQPFRRIYSFSTKPINAQTNIVTDILPQGVNTPGDVELMDLYSLPI